MFERQTPSSGLDASGKKRIIEVIITLVLTGAVLFGAAGRLDWLEAWIYLGGSSLLAAALSVVVIRRNPEVINARGRRSKKTKTWDKVLSAFLLVLVLAFIVVAGLDARFGWSDVSWWVKAPALVLLLLGTLMPYYAMLHNPFLATTVRIEEERGHRVATTGPYRWVRHPMYTGVTLSWLAVPVFLGSWWALLPAGASVILLIARTVLEDRTLRRELDGYVEYAARVPYRLVPRLW